MEPGDSSMAHEWARLVHEWARLAHEWARLAHECPSPVSSSSVFDRRHRSIHQMSRFMPSVRRHRTLRHSTLRVQVGSVLQLLPPGHADGPSSASPVGQLEKVVQHGADGVVLVAVPLVVREPQLSSSGGT